MDKPENRQKAIRIMLADDHLIVREGLVGVPSEEPDFELVGFAENGEKEWLTRYVLYHGAETICQRV